MGQGKITAKQQEILTYIKECILKKGLSAGSPRKSARLFI